MPHKPHGNERVQFAALPWRRTPDGLRILLITSRETHRWLIPKGWPMKNKSPAEAAAQEAYEEAGVLGAIDEAPLGRYHYAKGLTSAAKRTIKVTVFALEVRLEQESWPEEEQREKQWLAAGEAARLIEEPELQALISAFGQGGQARAMPP